MYIPNVSVTIMVVSKFDIDVTVGAKLDEIIKVEVVESVNNTLALSLA